MIKILRRRLHEDPNDSLPFPAWLKAKRKEKGWTQEKLAEEMGYDTSLIGKIERYKRDATEEFQRIARDVLD